MLMASQILFSSKVDSKLIKKIFFVCLQIIYLGSIEKMQKEGGWVLFDDQPHLKLRIVANLANCNGTFVLNRVIQDESTRIVDESGSLAIGTAHVTSAG